MSSCTSAGVGIATAIIASPQVHVISNDPILDCSSGITASNLDEFAITIRPTLRLRLISIAGILAVLPIRTRLVSRITAAHGFIAAVTRIAAIANTLHLRILDCSSVITANILAALVIPALLVSRIATAHGIIAAVTSCTTIANTIIG